MKRLTLADATTLLFNDEITINELRIGKNFSLITLVNNGVTEAIKVINGRKVSYAKKR